MIISFSKTQRLINLYEVCFRFLFYVFNVFNSLINGTYARNSASIILSPCVRIGARVSPLQLPPVKAVDAGTPAAARQATVLTKLHPQRHHLQPPTDAPQFASAFVAPPSRFSNLIKHIQIVSVTTSHANYHHGIRIRPSSFG